MAGTNNTSISNTADGSGAEMGALLSPTSTTTTSRNNASETTLSGAADTMQSEDLQLPDTPAYGAISMTRSATLLSLIIFGNCLTCASICLCYWGFSKKLHIMVWERRLFNTLSLLFSAGLGFGIGYLCDSIGLLARGVLLQRKPYSKKCIGYILRGELTHYIKLCWREPSVVLLLFILFSVLGRFGVAFLGFAYNLDETVNITPPLLRPDWQNLTVTHQIGYEMYDQRVLNLLSRSAQIIYAPPLLASESLGDQDLQQSQNYSIFSSMNYEMNVTGDKVFHTYRFQNFREPNISQYAHWDLVMVTQCQRLIGLSPDTKEGVFFATEDNGGRVRLPFWSANLTDIPLGRARRPGRWISAENRTGPPPLDWTKNRMLDSDGEYDPIYIHWLIVPSIDADSGDGLLKFRRAVGSLDLIDDMGEETLAFKCILELAEASTSSEQYKPAWPYYYENNEWKPATGVELKPIMNRNLRKFLLAPFTVDTLAISRGSTGIWESWNDVGMPFISTFSLALRNRTASELWLAGYMGNYVANVMNFLSGMLRQVEIEPTVLQPQTQLLVRWDRVLTIMTIITVFQVLVTLGALRYCRGSFEILDDVSTLSSMLERFSKEPVKDEQQNQKEYVGTFVLATQNARQENDRKYHWVFEKKQE